MNTTKGLAQPAREAPRKHRPAAAGIAAGCTTDLSAERATEMAPVLLAPAATIILSMDQERPMSDLLERLRELVPHGFDSAGQAAAEIERLRSKADAWEQSWILADADRVRLRAALASVVKHWREFGPEHGFDETLERAALAGVAPIEPGYPDSDGLPGGAEANKRELEGMGGSVPADVALATLRELDDYLSRSSVEAIHSFSQFHMQIREACGRTPRPAHQPGDRP